MATKKLSANQAAALKLLAATGEGSAYSLSTRISTLDALCARGLVAPIGHGHLAFPQNGTWKITKAGRAAVQAP